MLTPRQEQILRKVVVAYQATVQPVASRTLAADPELQAGPSTVRHELAELEALGLLAHPHTSAGRVPTDSGYRYFVDRLLPARSDAAFELELTRREVDAAMRATTATLSQITNLLAVVSAPPIDTATIRHIEVLLLQPQIAMIVIITSTGGVSKRVLAFDAPVDSGLVTWAAEFLNEQLNGVGLGARKLHARLADRTLSQTERSFLDRLMPAFTNLAATAEDSLYVDGAARLMSEYRFHDLTEINALMQMLEGRVTLLEMLRTALGERDVVVRIGAENESPALRSLAMVAAGYGLPLRPLGTVSLIGPVAMDYAMTIGVVREAAAQLSRFVEDVYDA
ncbi:MAG: Heat-inducible transcription repressor HrcA [uncultured Solirubrobacteraceae bacterium]|uniref:Heat-inducible transcription repressor HrcA n=1 Tax=uncultured Solirubrobacteraceae bacterium TaxID=1162706 RepID=A0A6J4RHK5_9ACTN|nr:MAG: Heat-inducible transcription repressor HrcA [uncultured Solirubrobacteraceae bacterium]